MITTISTLPAVPNRNDPTTFSDKADTLLGAMPTLVTELNNFVSEVNTLSFKTACRVATTTNITLSGTQTIDGISVAAGDRVLVKDQNTQAQNGIYVVGTSTWTRAADMDTAAEVAGSFVPITFGATQGGKIYYTTFNATGGVLGTTAIPWSSLTDSTFNVTGPGVLGAANGGTGNSSYSVGDLIYASAATTLTKLNAAASGNVLKSGTAPSWGKVALASDVSGTLPVANGGTGISATTGAIGTTFLTSNGTGGWVEATLPGSSTSSSGIVQLATDAEVIAGITSVKAITPSTLRANSMVRSGTVGLTGLTEYTFTGIPSWAKRITLVFQNISATTNNTGSIIQVGTSGGMITTGYTGHLSALNNSIGNYYITNGFLVYPDSSPNTSAFTGTLVLYPTPTVASVTATGTALYTSNNGAMQFYAGYLGSVASIDRVKILTTNTTTYDSGTITLYYE